jgi:hypothetical protein
MDQRRHQRISQVSAKALAPEPMATAPTASHRLSSSSATIATTEPAIAAMSAISKLDLNGRSSKGASSPEWHKRGLSTLYLPWLGA